MIQNMNTNRRKAAFVLMMIFLYTRESVFWDWEVPWNIYRTHLISTQKMMRKRIHKLWWKLWRHKGFDILVTHAPAYKLNDMEDLPHRGFKAFLDLMDKYHPKYFLHGHVHANYGSGFKRKDVYGTTR